MTMKTTAWMLPVRKILAFRMSSASYHGFLSSIVSATSLARSPPRGSRSIGERNHTSLALFSQPAEVEPGVEERRLKTSGRNHCQETHQSKTPTWAHRIDPSSLYATAGTKMSATGTKKRTLQLAHHMAGLGPVRGEDLTSPTPGQHARCARPHRIL